LAIGNSLEFTYLQAVIIGFIQGITELFPISSLGHAILIPAWLGGSFKEFISIENQTYLLISIAMHLASSVALFLVFRKRWFNIILGSITAAKSKNFHNTQFKVLSYIVIATIPVGVLGLAFDEYFQSIFGKPEFSAVFLAINGLILIGAERLSRRDQVHELADSDAEIDHRVNVKSAVVIGFGQCLALFAGISRFGITMSAGLLSRLNHSVASDFAFLLSLPVILGAAIVKLPELFTTDANQLMGQIILGSAVSFVCTYISVTFLVRWFKTRTLYPFAIYCLGFGFLSLVRFA
jgi:undecaprenyl-diphosphatase